MKNKVIKICAWTIAIFAVASLVLMLICNQIVVNNAGNTRDRYLFHIATADSFKVRSLPLIFLGSLCLSSYKLMLVTLRGRQKSGVGRIRN